MTGIAPIDGSQRERVFVTTGSGCSCDDPACRQHRASDSNHGQKLSSADSLLFRLYCRHSSPVGYLILMGVTEDRVPINTRDVLEKGITVVGSSCSSYKDFHAVLSAMEDASYQAILRRLLPEKRITINSVQDFISSMDDIAAHRDWRKTVLDFQWH